jgi:peroxiredoxin
MLRKPAFNILIFLIVFFAFISSCSKIEENRDKPKPGYYAPDFTLDSIDGKKYKLSDFRGKVVFVNFWATWCPPCKEEIPSMGQLYKDLSGEGLVMLAISVDNDEEVLRKFVKNHNVPFPVLLDPEKKVYNLYKATGVPETHLINKLGMIEGSRIGSFNWVHPETVGEVKELMAQ